MSARRSVAVILPDEAADAIHRQAARRRMSSAASYLRLALRQQLERDGESLPPELWLANHGKRNARRAKTEAGK